MLRWNLLLGTAAAAACCSLGHAQETWGTVVAGETYVNMDDPPEYEGDSNDLYMEWIFSGTDANGFFIFVGSPPTRFDTPVPDVGYLNNTARRPTDSVGLAQIFLLDRDLGPVDDLMTSGSIATEGDGPWILDCVGPNAEMRIRINRDSGQGGQDLKPPLQWSNHNGAPPVADMRIQRSRLPVKVELGRKYRVGLMVSGLDGAVPVGLRRIVEEVPSDFRVGNIRPLPQSITEVYGTDGTLLRTVLDWDVAQLDDSAATYEIEAVGENALVPQKFASAVIDEVEGDQISLMPVSSVVIAGEFYRDCDGNQQEDAIDILLNPALDLNNNAILDSCE